jgi:hypothetical protein
VAYVKNREVFCDPSAKEALGQTVVISEEHFETSSVWGQTVTSLIEWHSSVIPPLARQRYVIIIFLVLHE